MRKIILSVALALSSVFCYGQCQELYQELRDRAISSTENVSDVVFNFKFGMTEKQYLKEARNMINEGTLHTPFNITAEQRFSIKEHGETIGSICATFRHKRLIAVQITIENKDALNALLSAPMFQSAELHECNGTKYWIIGNETITMWKRSGIYDLAFIDWKEYSQYLAENPL